MLASPSCNLPVFVSNHIYYFYNLVDHKISKVDSISITIPFSTGSLFHFILASVNLTLTVKGPPIFLCIVGLILIMKEFFNIFVPYFLFLLWTIPLLILCILPNLWEPLFLSHFSLIYSFFAAHVFFLIFLFNYFIFCTIPWYCLQSLFHHLRNFIYLFLREGDDFVHWFHYSFL